LDWLKVRFCSKQVFREEELLFLEQSEEHWRSIGIEYTALLNGSLAHMFLAIFPEWLVNEKPNDENSRKPDNECDD